MRLQSPFQVKEPLRETRYNTKDELIRAIGRSIRNINEDGRADSVGRLPNSWQKEISKRVTYMLYPVNKAMSEIPNVAITFYPALVVKERTRAVSKCIT